jgi:hypothetical protein
MPFRQGVIVPVKLAGSMLLLRPGAVRPSGTAAATTARSRAHTRDIPPRRVTQSCLDSLPTPTHPCLVPQSVTSLSEHRRSGAVRRSVTLN